MVHICCVCQKVKGTGGWQHEMVPSGELASHGYCPECAAVARFRLELLRFQMRYLSLTRSLGAA